MKKMSHTSSMAGSGRYGSNTEGGEVMGGGTERKGKGGRQKQGEKYMHIQVVF
jgi:hypothetical protein